jgi:hydrogenase expression/formation protein HypE
VVITMSRACDRLHVLRDPTRGGATTLNKIAEPSERNVVIHQSRIRVHDAIAAACETRRPRMSIPTGSHLSRHWALTFG